MWEEPPGGHLEAGAGLGQSVVSQAKAFVALICVQVAEAAGRAGGACCCNQWPRGCYGGQCTWRAGPAG